MSTLDYQSRLDAKAEKSAKQKLAAAPAAEPAAKPRGLNLFERVLVFALCFMGTYCVLIAVLTRFDFPSSAENRFQTDNAVGASANALESIDKKINRDDQTDFFQNALLMYVLAAAISINGNLRLVSRRE